MKGVKAIKEIRYLKSTLSPDGETEVELSVERRSKGDGVMELHLERQKSINCCQSLDSGSHGWVVSVA